MNNPRNPEIRATLKVTTADQDSKFPWREGNLEISANGHGVTFEVLNEDRESTKFKLTHSQFAEICKLRMCDPRYNP